MWRRLIIPRMGITRRRRLSSMLTAGALLGGSTLGGCSSACTLVGGFTGFSITVLSPAMTDPTFEICLDDDCQKLVPDFGFSTSKVAMVADGRLNGPAAVEVGVTALDGTGARLAGGTTTVRLTPSEPNGPKCGTHWSAAVTLDGDQLRPS